MNREGMQGFAGGIIFAVIVFSFFYYLVFNIPSATKADQTLTSDQVSTYLKSHDKVAISTDEYGSLKDAVKQNTSAHSSTKASTKKSNTTNTSSTAKQKNSSNKTKTSSQGPSVIHYTLNIKPGMLGSDAADQLQAAHIIKNADALSQYLKDHQLMRYVQIGKFKVSSDMSISQIAHIISK